MDTVLCTLKPVCVCLESRPASANALNCSTITHGAQSPIRTETNRSPLVSHTRRNLPPADDTGTGISISIDESPTERQSPAIMP